MKCKLCNQEKNLIKKSHLIPDFFFKSLYNEHGRLIKIDAVKMFNGIEEKPSRPPSSTYERFILCAECDNEVINRYESYYAKNIFHGTEFTKRIFPEPSKINHYEYNNLDFNLANIFFLTLLWRANLSDKQGFRDVNLLPKIAESIRTQILSGRYDKDIVKITAVRLSEDSNFKRSVTQFKKIENYYSIILRDIIVFFHFENDGTYSFTKNHGIGEKGTWILPEIPKSMEEKFLFSYINPQRKS